MAFATMLSLALNYQGTIQRNDIRFSKPCRIMESI